jgi:hypothetical protein
MRVGAVPRKYADSVVEGEGIHLVVLGSVFLCGKVLKIGQYMEAADRGAIQRDYVVYVVVRRALPNKLSHL